MPTLEEKTPIRVEAYRWKIEKKDRADGKEHPLCGVHFENVSALAEIDDRDCGGLIPEGHVNRNEFGRFRDRHATNALGRTWYDRVGSMEKVKETVEGWKAGADRAVNMAQELRDDLGNLEPVAIKRTRVWTDEGDELDYDRFRNGDLEIAWRGSRRRKRAKLAPAITIVVNWANACSQSAEQLFWTGAVGVALVDLLENAGYETAVVAAAAGWQRGARSQSIVSVSAKDFGDPLRIEALAGLLCHAGVYRTLGFYGYTALPCSVDSSLGGVEDVRNVTGEDEFEPFAGTTILEVPSCYSREAAATMLRSLLEKVADVEAC